MVVTKRLKHPYLWLQSFFNSSARNYFGGAVCIIGETTKLHDKHFVYWFILYHISSSQAFCSREVQFRSSNANT